VRLKDPPINYLPPEPTRVKAQATVFARRYIKVGLTTCSASGHSRSYEMIKVQTKEFAVTVDIAAIMRAIAMLIVVLL